MDVVLVKIHSRTICYFVLFFYFVVLVVCKGTKRVTIQNWCKKHSLTRLTSRSTNRHFTLLPSWMELS